MFFYFLLSGVIHIIIYFYNIFYLKTKDMNKNSMSEEQDTKSSASVAAEQKMEAITQLPDPKPRTPSYASRNSKIFKAITEFADQLNDAFGKDNINVNKVYRILMKTSLTNRKVVDRHLVIFHSFLELNRMPILGRIHTEFIDPNISLTERIQMNMREIIEKADEPTRKIIWQHLFNIMFLFNPEDELVKNELKLSIADNDTRENKFLMDTFSKFENVMKSNTDGSTKDPMSMMGNLLNSGFLNDMMGNINNGVNKGDLNIKSLISTVQNLLGNLSETIDKEEKKDTKWTTK